MRLHELVVTAFGPFAGTERLDFDVLGQAGLFLLHGPTGAGKSSVLDAVCFALYGQVPGERQRARALSSDHAPPGSRPEVELETTIRGRRLRITRSPRWDRPKHRGPGLVLEQARVHVQELTEAGWVARSTRIDEAAQLLTGLLGMSVAQFCQVVLLPQGQFAEFLRSEADQRRALLESLFDTRRFTDVERWLVDRRQEAARRLGAADDEVAQVVARVVEAAGLTAQPADVPPDRLTTWIGDLRATAQAAVAQAAPLVEHRRTEALAAQAAVNAARMLLSRQQRHAELLEARQALRSGAEQRAELGAELAAARRAAPVVPVLEALAEAERAWHGASRRAERSGWHRCGALGPDCAAPSQQDDSRARAGCAAPLDTAELAAQTAQAGGEAATLRAQAATLRGELGRLEELHEVEGDADRVSRHADEAASAAEASRTAGDEDRAWLAEWPARRGRAETTVEQAQRAEASLAGRRAECQAARVRCDAAFDRDRLTGEAERARALLAHAVDEAQGRRQGWLDVRQRRLEGVAAELALALVAGEPCTVCGSATHPAPAPFAQGDTPREQEAAAERAWHEADERRRVLDDAARTVEHRRVAARALAGGDGPVAASEAELAVAQERWEGAADVAAGLAGHRLELGRLDAEATRRQSARGVHERTAAAALARAEQLREQVAGLRATVDAGRGEDVSLAARAARLQGEVAAGEAQAKALEDLQRAGATLAGAAALARRRCEDAGFEAMQEARSAIRPPARISAAEESLRRAERDEDRVDTLLTDPQLAAAAKTVAPDLAGLEVAARRSAAQHESAVAQMQAATARHDALVRLAAVLGARLADRLPELERHQVVDRLSRLAEGKSADNALRMSLSAYVLAARLEAVAQRASDRLARMSGGRYTLLHRDQAGAGRRGGLGLAVVDAWTGRERETSTLSGGESFLASLSLALGLADVVTAEAGGAVLETLFVDEGFGTLDEDTLEEVMDVLDGLRSGGRTVGLVSHVAELRQRIPAQVTVRKGRSGSSLRQT